jgi:hypothetical protein
MMIPFSATESPVKISAGPPDATAPHVLAFCERINGSSLPVSLAIQPEPECLARECFPNVRHKVEREGGRIQYGWSISEWPRVFIEAQHHAVYEGPAGPSWLDITPSGPEEDYPQERRLFLPDDWAVYDFDNPRVRDNIRQALTADPLIHEYLGLAAELVAIVSRTPGTGEIMIEGADAERVQSIATRSSFLKRSLAMKYTSQGAPCFCGSGQEFKRCHGSPRKEIR